MLCIFVQLLHIDTNTLNYIVSEVYAFVKILIFHIHYKNIFRCICLFICKLRIIIGGYLASIGVLYAYRYISILHQYFYVNGKCLPSPFLRLQ